MCHIIIGTPAIIYGVLGMEFLRLDDAKMLLSAVIPTVTLGEFLPLLSLSLMYVGAE